MRSRKSGAKRAQTGQAVAAKQRATRRKKNKQITSDKNDNEQNNEYGAVVEEYAVLSAGKTVGAAA